MPPSRALGPLLLSVAVVALWVAARPWFAGVHPFQPYHFRHLMYLGEERERRFYLGVLLFEALLIASLTLGWSRLWSDRHDAGVAKLVASGRSTYAQIALGSGVLAFAVGMVVVRQHTLTEDEKTYLFQAKLLLGGRLTMPVPDFPRAFWEPFVVEAHGRWSGQYFWAYPALLALGLLIHLPALFPALAFMTAVYFTGLLVEEYAGDRRAGVLAALLLATSPLAFFTAGSLHSATLSMACGTVALWSINRVARNQSSVGSAVALGLAVAVGLNNRPLDIAALAVGAGAVLFYRRRDDLLRVLVRLAPSIGIALLSLVVQAFLNRAVSGDYRHSGYWLFNEGHGFTTMGFGKGPFGYLHTPAMATIKTLTVWLRVAFYTTGAPYALLLVILPFPDPVGSMGTERRGRTPAVIVLVYAVAYFLYPGASILTTGPIYYDAIMPVMAGWIALSALTWHERVRSRPWGRGLVPAFLLAQAVAALVVFWPPELMEIANARKSASACERLPEQHGISRALIFVRGGAEAPASWTYWPPLPLPNLDDPILFAASRGHAADAAAAARYANGRPVYIARCVQEASPSLATYEPVTDRVAPLDGTSPGGR
jgi:hypothetical protein